MFMLWVVDYKYEAFFLSVFYQPFMSKKSSPVNLIYCNAISKLRNR